MTFRFAPFIYLDLTNLLSHCPTGPSLHEWTRTNVKPANDHPKTVLNSPITTKSTFDIDAYRSMDKTEGG